MGFTHTWEYEGVYVNFFNELTSQEIIHSNSQLFGKPEFESLKFAIFDFTNIIDIEIDDSDASIASSFTVRVNPYNININVALISNNKELQPLLTNYMKETFKQIPHIQLKLFENITEAKAWVAS